MSDSGERLVVLLEARVSDFERRMRQAERTGTRSFTGLRQGARSATRDMEAAMARSAASINRSVASVTGTIGSLARASAGAFLGGVAIGGMTELVASSREVVKGLAEVGNEAKRAGLSAQAFQEWAYVAQSNRISVDALVDGFKELSLRADEFIVTGAGPAAEAFTRVGLRAEELKAKLKDPSALMQEIMQRLEGMDKAAQIRIADELFGGTGGERFVELLGQGEGALRDTIDRAHEVGAVMDDQVIAKAQELDQKFRDLQTSAGNFFKRMVVGAAEAASELADTRSKVEELFSSEAEGRNLVGSPSYDAMADNRDTADAAAQDVRQLQGDWQLLAETVSQTTNEMRGSIGLLDSWGYDDAANAMRETSDQMDALVDGFRANEIAGEDFAAQLVEVQNRAADAFAQLEAGDRTSFTGVMSQLQRLGGVISQVTALAVQMKNAIASAAGTAPAQVTMNAMRERQSAEAASMASLKAMTDANDKFTASENGRNAATREQVDLEREATSVRKRAQSAGAVLTDAEVNRFAADAIAGDAARSAGGGRAEGGGGGGGRSKRAGGGGGGGGGGGAARESDYQREAKQIRERIDSYNIEAQVLAAAAVSGENYGDVMAYASQKAELLAAAQKDGKAITPALTAEIDGLARSYAEAGQRADEASEHLKKVQAAGERGAEAVAGIFGSALQGANAAKQAVVQLLQRLAEIQLTKAFKGLAEGGGAAGEGFAWLGGLLSYDGGGYTGGGSRTGGLDGKGGRMAILHPQETVIDHTKGGKATARQEPSKVHITVSVSPTGEFDARVADISGQVASAHVQAADRALPGRMAAYNRNPRARNG